VRSLLNAATERALIRTEELQNAGRPAMQTKKTAGYQEEAPERAVASHRVAPHK
jgi:hypothetical protein